MKTSSPESNAHRRLCPWHVLGLLTVMLVPATAPAEVVWIEIDRQEPFARGHSFGDVGPYEKITGKLHIEVDPSHPANRQVVDLDLAPKSPQGKVAFWTEFFLLKPAGPNRGNRCLFYDVNNRGNKLALAAFNEARSNDPSTLADAGNGFLFRRGYAILWCGWNGDVKPGDNRLQIELPVARHPNGEPITGKIYSEICVNTKSFSEPLCWGNTRVYPAVSLDNGSATLTMRPRRAMPAVECPRDQWAFARREDGKVIPDPTYLYLKDGFRPGWLYDLVYVGKHPRVAGLGSVAVRDAISFLRYAAKDSRGQPNPLAGAIERAYVFGISQSGRFIHHFLYQNFNGDEQGRMVFDAAFAHVGATGKGIFNRRFAQITRHGSHHEENLYPTDVFPFTTVPQNDPATGRRADWLARSRTSGHLPKLFITQTSTEYWARGGSLLHTDVQGRHDVGLDQNVRLYHIAGTHHLFFTPKEQGINRYPLNTLNYQALLRALLVALDQWVTAGREPPESQYPRLADGTLVDLQTYHNSFPHIPGVVLPESLYAPLRLDPGPRWETEGIADHVPPKIGEPYRTLVPAVDADGNELAGIRLPHLSVPLATHVGWNVRAADYGAGGMLARWVGSSWPLPRTPEEAKRTADPRRSIAERYPTRPNYITRLAEAASQLQRRRLLLEEDVVVMTQAADRPNVILVLVDDLGWAELGCYGNSFNETPNLDRMAAEGVRFTEAYAAAPVCSPTRVSLMTGCYPARIGITDYLRRDDPKFLSPEVVTFTELLQEHGYATGLIGKWHLMGDYAKKRGDPALHGFDEVICSETSYIAGGKYFHPYFFMEHVPARHEGEYLTDRLNEEAVDFIARHKHEPFFLLLSHYAVHAHLSAKKEMIEKYQNKPGADKNRNNPVLAAMIQSIDEGVGLILATLHEYGLADNTILVFASDNGGQDRLTSNAPLRGGKSQLYEGGIRVPLIVRWPAGAARGSVCHVATSTIDFYPTFVDLAGAKPDSKLVLDGVSIKPLFQQEGQLKRDALYWHYPLPEPHFLGGRSSGCVRQGDFKLIEFYDTSEIELYDLSADPGEQNNLATAMPDKASKLQKLLTQCRRDTRAIAPVAHE